MHTVHTMFGTTQYRRLSTERFPFILWETLDNFISPFSLSLLPFLAWSVVLLAFPLNHLLVHSYMAFYFVCVCEWVSVCPVNEWTGQFINIKFGSALFPVYPLLVNDTVSCESLIVAGVWVRECVHCYFLLSIPVRGMAIWLGCLLHIHYIYEYVKKMSEWDARYQIRFK